MLFVDWLYLVVIDECECGECGSDVGRDDDVCVVVVVDCIDLSVI